MTIRFRKRCLVYITILSFLVCLISPAEAEQRLIPAVLPPLMPNKQINLSLPINLPPILTNGTGASLVNDILNISLDASDGLSINVSLGPANITPVSPSNLSREDWQRLIAKSRAEKNGSDIIVFPDTQSIVANSSVMGSAQAPLWLNGSGVHGEPGVLKMIQHKRIITLIDELELVNRSVAGSSLDADEKARLAGSLGDNARWLIALDGEIQAPDDMASLGDGIARAEGQMATIRSVLRADAGLLACEDMDTRVDEAMHVSAMVDEKLKGMALTAADRAWYDAALAGYDRHVYTASLYTSTARESFGKVPEAADGNACYADGLARLELAQGELSLSFTLLEDIFRHMNK